MSDPMHGKVLAFRTALLGGHPMDPPFRCHSWSNYKFTIAAPERPTGDRPMHGYVWHVYDEDLDRTIAWLRDGWPRINVEGLALFGRVIDADMHVAALQLGPEAYA